MWFANRTRRYRDSNTRLSPKQFLGPIETVGLPLVYHPRIYSRATTSPEQNVSEFSKLNTGLGATRPGTATLTPPLNPLSADLSSLLRGNPPQRQRNRRIRSPSLPHTSSKISQSLQPPQCVPFPAHLERPAPLIGQPPRFLWVP